MLNVSPLIGRNPKMFDLNLSDSDEEQDADLNQADSSSNDREQLQNDAYRSGKQQIVSKTTKVSNHVKELGDELKQIKELAMKTSPVFNIKKSVPELYSSKKPQLKRLHSYHDNDKYINSTFNPKEPHSGEVRKLSGKNNNKKIVTKQKKKIEFLNSSMTMHDIEEITFKQSMRGKQTLKTQAKEKIYDIESEFEGDRVTHQAFDQNGIVEKHNDKIWKQNSRENVSENSDEQRFDFDEELEQQESILQNPQCIFDSANIKFKQIVYHDFDESNQSQNQGQQQQSNQNQSIEGEVQSQSNPKEEIINLFSQKFKTKPYIQMRNKFLGMLLCGNNLSQQPLQYNQNIRKLLSTAIPQSNMFEFEVHVYKDLFKTQYQLWIKFNSQQQEESILLAAAYNQTFHIDKSIFIIQQVNQLNQRQFIAQLQSNFARTFYSLYGYPSNFIESRSNNSLSSQNHSSQIQQILNISFNIYRTIYIPNQKLNTQNKVQKNYTPSNNKKNNQTQNLAQTYRKQKFSQSSQINKVSKLTTSKSLNFEHQFYSQYGVRKSNKTLLIQDSINRHQKLFIGKIVSKKYKLMIGQGLSPLQAFGILIAHVQCN